MKHIYNLKLSPVENRVHFQVPRHITSIADVPDSDVSGDIPYTLDQLTKGTCVEHACGVTAAHVDFKLHPEAGFITPACLFTSYNHRAKVKDITGDPGSSGYDYCEEAKKIGIPDASYWPYDLDKWAVRPLQSAYDAAIRNLLLEFQHIPVVIPSVAINLIRVAMHTNGFGVPCGIKIPADFEVQEVMDSGNYFKSNLSDIQGLHEVYVVGSYRNVPVPFVRFLNSWGKEVGKAGLNGLRGYFDVEENLFGQLLVEANVLTKTE